MNFSNLLNYALNNNILQICIINIRRYYFIRALTYLIFLRVYIPIPPRDIY